MERTVPRAPTGTVEQFPQILSQMGPAEICVD